MTYPHGSILILVLCLGILAFSSGILPTPPENGSAESGANLEPVSPLPAPEGRPEKPLALHPANPHYFLFRKKPAILVTSGEHYGAVLNLDFDYVRYLDTLHANGLNLTRTWSGSYREIANTFGITDNTLAPRPNRYVCPWARSGTSGYSDGGNKFDLTRWDAAYFQRLKDFMTV